MENFNVYTLDNSDSEELFRHWSDGLTMVIVKDNIRIELNEDEIRQLVNTLPTTVGGCF